MMILHSLFFRLSPWSQAPGIYCSMLPTWYIPAQKMALHSLCGMALLVFVYTTVLVQVHIPVVYLDGVQASLIS